MLGGVGGVLALQTSDFLTQFVQLFAELIALLLRMTKKRSLTISKPLITSRYNFFFVVNNVLSLTLTYLQVVNGGCLVVDGDAVDAELRNRRFVLAKRLLKLLLVLLQVGAQVGLLPGKDKNDSSALEKLKSVQVQWKVK